MTNNDTTPEYLGHTTIGYSETTHLRAIPKAAIDALVGEDKRTVTAWRVPEGVLLTVPETPSWGGVDFEGVADD